MCLSAVRGALYVSSYGVRVSVYFYFVHLSLVADCMSGMCVACVVSGV